MNRAVVMEIRNNVAVVMTPDGEFRKVQAGESVQVGDEIRLDEAALPRSRAWGAKARYGMGAAAAAIMLLLVTPYLVKIATPQPAVAAYLTMDINPSVELGIDGKERVMELHPLNPDGAKLIKGLEFKGETAETVAAAITSRARDAHYFDSEEGDVFITSVLMKGNEAYEDALTEHVNTAVKETLAAKQETGPATDAVKVSTLSVPAEVREEAKQSGVSSGKMAFYLLAKSEGHEVDLEELKHQSIHNTAKALGGVEKVIGTNKKAAEGDAAIDKKSIKTKLKELAAEVQSQRGQTKAKAGASAKPAAGKPEKDDSSAGSAAAGKTPSEPAKNGGKSAAGSQGAGAKAQQAKPAEGAESGKTNNKNDRWEDRKDDKQSKWRDDDDRDEDRQDEDDEDKEDKKNTNRQDGQQGGKTAPTGRHDAGSTGTQKDNVQSGAKASDAKGANKSTNTSSKNGKTTEKNSTGKSNARENENNGKSQRGDDGDDDDDDRSGSQKNGSAREDENESGSGKSQGRGQSKQQERENAASKSGSDRDSNKENGDRDD